MFHWFPLLKYIVTTDSQFQIEQVSNMKLWSHKVVKRSTENQVLEYIRLQSPDYWVTDIART
jgi:hypothetical protein